MIRLRRNKYVRFNLNKIKMKITKELKEVNVGIQVELSNVELLVLATESEKIIASSPTLRTMVEIGKDSNLKDSTVRVDSNSLSNILKFVQKFTGDVVSLEQAHIELFSGKETPLTEEDVARIVDYSTVGIDNESI